ncbi:MAG: hypothetical protein GXO87_00490, partial [Chlorobi bacterium]|nr:hypothetical protein [Chlorobiota bacterium]
MKRLLALFLITAGVIVGQNDSTFYAPFTGFTDSQNNAHLIYRVLHDDRAGFYHYNVKAQTEEFIVPSYWIGDGGAAPGAMRLKPLSYENGRLNFIETYKIPSPETYQIVTVIDDDTLKFIANGVKALDIFISAEDNSHIKIPFNDLTDPTNNGIYESFDSGRTWNVINNYDKRYKTRGISPYDMDLLFAFDSNGGFFVSEDGGENFTESVSSVNLEDYATFFFEADNQHFYAVDFNGIYSGVKNTPDYVWSMIKPIENENIYLALDPDQPGSFYFCSFLSNKIYRSTDFGATYEEYSSRERTVNGGLYLADDGSLFVAERFALYRSENNSETLLKKVKIESVNYYPLSVGNKWIYSVTEFSGANTDKYISSAEVLYDTLTANGKQYFFVRRGAGLKFDDEFERVGDDGFLYRYDAQENAEYISDDLAMRTYLWGDTLFFGDERYKYCSEISGQELFGETRNTKTIVDFEFPEESSYKFAYGFGMAEIYGGGDFVQITAKLKGAVIDGVAYGDTTVVVGIEPEESLPAEYWLGQNYPNPFSKNFGGNSSTAIKFSIPSSTTVAALKVYDVLGKEIATLVNEKL